MAWEKPSQELVARFDACLPASERVERRRMFGCPCAFVSGNMFAGIHEQDLILRLSETERARLVAARRARPFAVAGRTMREYVAVSGALALGEADVAALIADAFAFASGLPVKPRKADRASGSARWPRSR